MEKELNKPNITELMIKAIKKNIEKAQDNLKLYTLIEGNFFNEYLSKFNIFLSCIQDTYLIKLTTMKFDKKEEKDIFEYFMLFITNFNFEKLTQIYVMFGNIHFKIMKMI